MKHYTGYRPHFRKSVFFVVPLVALSLSTALGQDYSKVIAVVEKMESSLKTLIANEQKARQAEIGELRAQIQVLTEGRKPEGTHELSDGAQEQVVKHAADPLARLKEGNERFVAGRPSSKTYAADRAANVASQHPYAIVLSCADSRVPPELIFDESLGQLFVVRDAGNLVDSVVLGSIEYAAEHLKVQMLVVLGHESCGAIKATIAGGHVPPNIGSLVRRLVSPVEKTKARQPKDAELVSACVAENVRYQMEQTLAQSGLLAEMVEKGELTLRGGVYSLETGKVSFLEAPLHQKPGREPGPEKKETNVH